MLAAILSFLTPVVNRFFDNKDQADKFLAELNQALINNEAELRKAQRDIIVAEIGAGGPASTWRPHLMYLIMFLLAFNGVVVPLINAFFDVQLPVLDAWAAIPEDMWDLLKIGMGGYIIGRSAEKIVRDAAPMFGQVTPKRKPERNIENDYKFNE